MALNIGGGIRSIGNLGSSAFDKAKSLGGSAFSLLNPSNSRLSISGLFGGGASSGPKQSPTFGFRGQNGGTASATEDDWRVRVSLPEESKLMYRDPKGANTLMEPLIETNGVIFPYLPQISVSHVANYNSQRLTHSNYPQHYYQSSEVSDITIAGEFTVQSDLEGQYLMAAIYFFRSATKMFFGSGENAGNPPPILYLDGYGSHYFPHVPCVVSNFTHTLPGNVDYVEVPVTTTDITEITREKQGVTYLDNDGLNNVPSHLRSSAGTGQRLQETIESRSTMTTHTRVPTTSTVSITLKPIYSRKNLAERFNLDQFSSGKLLADQDKKLGGFL